MGESRFIYIGYRDVWLDNLEMGSGVVKFCRPIRPMTSSLIVKRSMPSHYELTELG